MSPPAAENAPPAAIIRAMWSRRRLAIAALAALAVIQPLAGQSGAPKDAFLNALGRFSLALDGSLGDEGTAIRSSLDELTRSLDEWNAVIKGYETAMAADIGAADPPLAARMHLALAGAYLDRHRIDAGLRELRAAAALDPALAQVHTLLGALHSQVTGDAAAAAEAFQTAAALSPSDAVNAYLLARQLSKLGRDDEARTILRPVVGEATLRAVLQNRTPAQALFIRLTLVPERAGVEPFFPPLRYRDGFDRLRLGDYEGAIAAFRQAADGDALVTDSGPHRDAVNRAAAAFRDGDAGAAVDLLTEAVESAPDRPEPRRLLGAAYAFAGQYDEAVAALEHAIRLAPQDERARLALAQVLMEAGRLPDARESLRRTLSDLPQSGRALHLSAALYQREGMYADAVRDFTAAAQRGPLIGLNGIYETLGRLHSAQQDVDAAAAAHGLRVDVHPNDADAHYDLGEMYMRRARQDEALAEFAIALLLNPAHAAAAASMAQAHLRSGSPAAAAEAARRALELDAEHSEARYVLGTALVRLGRAEEGRRELEIFQRQQADAAAARTRMFEVEGLRRDAMIAAAEGNHPRAVELLRKVAALEDSHTSRLELGLALLDAGQPAEALDHLNAAARLGAPYVIHQYLADAYEALGRAADSARELASYERIHREALRRRAAGAIDAPGDLSPGAGRDRR